MATTTVLDIGRRYNIVLEDAETGEPVSQPIGAAYYYGSEVDRGTACRSIEKPTPGCCIDPTDFLLRFSLLDPATREQCRHKPA